MTDSLASTISLDRAGATTWDVAVIGAGPAGAFASRQIASAGASVLLVDKSSFPRYKVCGCCLNAAALKILHRGGLDRLAALASAPRLTELCLAVGGSEFSIAIPSGIAVSRDQFDAALVAEAIGAGASFLPAVHATVSELSDGSRRVKLAGSAGAETAKARVVLVADGLGGRSLSDLEDFAVQTSPRSRIGAGAITTAYPASYQTGKIYMACAEGNYVGLVRLPDNHVDIAAAFRPDFCREKGGPGTAAEYVLRAAGLPAIAAIRDLPWRGTAALTRRRQRIAGERLFVIGDSALYVEPFTGEGMAWALRSAEAVSPLVTSGISHWKHSLVAEWNQIHARMIGHHGTLAALLGELIRHQGILSGLANMVAKAPALAGPVLKYITAL